MLLNLVPLYMPAPPGEILQRRELRGGPLRGRHLEIPGRQQLYTTPPIDSFLLKHCWTLHVCLHVGMKPHFKLFFLLLFLLLRTGVGVEDPGISGLPQPNTEPDHRLGPAGRLPALCLLCDRTKVSGSRPSVFFPVILKLVLRSC